MVHGGWAGAIDRQLRRDIALSRSNCTFLRESAFLPGKCSIYGYMVIYGTFEDISTIFRILDLF